MHSNSDIISRTFEEEIALNGSFVYITHGTSMLPLIHECSDVSIISKVPKGGPKKYDVILYKSNGKYIFHRLISIKKDGSYLVLGDNCLTVETYVKDDMIIGILTGLTRKGKKINLNGFKYKLYVHTWCDCYKIRIFFLRLQRKFVALKRKLFKNK